MIRPASSRDRAGSAGTSAPARITTSTPALGDAAMPAAPGLRPRRGSQHRSRLQAPGVGGQRRDFGPGEDHNTDVGPPVRRRQRAAPGLRPRRGSQLLTTSLGASPRARQRRDFGPGEDHN